MKFQLIGPWPSPHGYLEPDTIIDGTSPEWRGVVMPFEAMALDVDAANALVEWHPFNQRLLRFAAGIKPTVKINV